MALSKSFIRRTQSIFTTYLGNKTNFTNYYKVRSFSEYSKTIYHSKNLLKEQKFNDKFSNIYLLKKHSLKCFSKYNFCNDKTIFKALSSIFHLKRNVKNLNFLRNNDCLRLSHTLCNHGGNNDLFIESYKLFKKNKKYVSYKNTKEDQLNESDSHIIDKPGNKNNENNPVKSSKKSNVLKQYASDLSNGITTENSDIKCDNELSAYLECDKGSISKIPEEILERKIDITKIKNIENLELADKINSNKPDSLISLPLTESVSNINDSIQPFSNGIEMDENNTKPSGKSENDFIRVEDFLKTTDFIVDRNKVIDYYKRSTEEMMRNYHDGADDFFQNLPEVMPHFIIQENINVDNKQTNINSPAENNTTNLLPFNESRDFKTETKDNTPDKISLLDKDDILNETKTIAQNNEFLEKMKSKVSSKDNNINNPNGNVNSDVSNKNTSQPLLEEKSNIETNSKGPTNNINDKNYSKVLNDLEINPNPPNEIVMKGRLSTGDRISDSKSCISRGIITKIHSSKYHSDSKKDLWILSDSAEKNKLNRSQSRDKNKSINSNNPLDINCNKLINMGEDTTKTISPKSQPRELKNAIDAQISHLNNTKEYAKNWTLSKNIRELKLVTDDIDTEIKNRNQSITVANLTSKVKREEKLQDIDVNDDNERKMTRNNQMSPDFVFSENENDRDLFLMTPISEENLESLKDTEDNVFILTKITSANEENINDNYADNDIKMELNTNHINGPMKENKNEIPLKEYLRKETNYNEIPDAVLLNNKNPSRDVKSGLNHKKFNSNVLECDKEISSSDGHIKTTLVKKTLDKREPIKRGNMHKYVEKQNSTEQKTCTNNFKSNRAKTVSKEDTDKSSVTKKINSQFGIEEINATNYKSTNKKQKKQKIDFKSITKHSCINKDEITTNSLNFTNSKNSMKSKKYKFDNVSHLFSSLRKEISKRKKDKHNAVERSNNFDAKIVTQNKTNTDAVNCNVLKDKKTNRKSINDEKNTNFRKDKNISLDQYQIESNKNNEESIKELESKISPAINVNFKSSESKLTFDELEDPLITKIPQSKQHTDNYKDSLNTVNPQLELTSDKKKKDSLTEHSPCCKLTISKPKPKESLIANNAPTKLMIEKSKDLVNLPTKDSRKNVEGNMAKSCVQTNYIFEELDEINSDLSNLVLDVKRFCGVDNKLNYINSPSYISPAIDTIFDCSTSINEFHSYDNIDDLFVLTETDDFRNLHGLPNTAEDKIIFSNELRNEKSNVFGNEVDMTENSITSTDKTILSHSDDNENFNFNPVDTKKMMSNTNSSDLMEKNVSGKSVEHDKTTKNSDFQSTGKHKNETNSKILNQLDTSSSKSLPNKQMNISEEKLDIKSNTANLDSGASSTVNNKTTTDALRAFEDFYLRKPGIDENFDMDTGTDAKFTEKLSNISEKPEKIEHFSDAPVSHNTKDDTAGNNNKKSTNILKSDESCSNFGSSKNVEHISPIEYFINREIPTNDKEVSSNPFGEVNHSGSSEVLHPVKELNKTKFYSQSGIPKPIKQQLSVSPAELKKFYKKNHIEQLWQPRKDYNQNFMRRLNVDGSKNESSFNVPPTLKGNRPDEAADTHKDSNKTADKIVSPLTNFKPIKGSGTQESIKSKNNEQPNKASHEIFEKLNKTVSNENHSNRSVISNHSLPIGNSFEGLTNHYYSFNNESIDKQTKSNSQIENPSDVYNNEQAEASQYHAIGDSKDCTNNENYYENNNDNENRSHEYITEEYESNDHELKEEINVNKNEEQRIPSSLYKKYTDKTNNNKVTESNCGLVHSKLEHNAIEIDFNDQVKNDFLITQNVTNVSKPEEYTDTTIHRLTKKIFEDDQSKDIAEIQSLIKLLSEFYDCQKGESSSITDELLMLGKKYKEIIEKEERHAKNDENSEEDFWDIDSIITNCMIEASTGCVVQDYSLDLIDSKTRFKIMQEIFESEQLLQAENILTDQSKKKSKTNYLNEEFFRNFSSKEENVNYKTMNGKGQITKHFNNAESNKRDKSKTFNLTGMMNNSSNINNENESNEILEYSPEKDLKPPEPPLKDSSLEDKGQSNENPNLKKNSKDGIYKSNGTILENINLQRPFSTFSQPINEKVIKNKKEDSKEEENKDTTKRIYDHETNNFQRKLRNKTENKTINLRMDKELHDPKTIVESEIKKMQESVHYIKCLNHPSKNFDLMASNEYLKSKINSKITEETFHKGICHAERKENTTGKLKTVGYTKTESQYVMYPLMVTENGSKTITKQDAFYNNCRSFSSKSKDENITNKGIAQNSKIHKQEGFSNKSTPPISTENITKENKTVSSNKKSDSGSDMLRILQNALIKKIKEKVQKLEQNHQQKISKTQSIRATSSSSASLCNIINLKQNTGPPVLVKNNSSLFDIKNKNDENSLSSNKRESGGLEKGIINSQFSAELTKIQEKKESEKENHTKEDKAEISNSEKSNKTLPKKLNQTFTDKRKKDCKDDNDKQPVCLLKQKQTPLKKAYVQSEEEKNIKADVPLKNISKNSDKPTKSLLASGKKNILLDDIMNVTKTVINNVPVKESLSKQKTHMFSDIIYGNSSKKHQPILKIEQNTKNKGEHLKGASLETHHLKKRPEYDFNKTIKSSNQKTLIKKCAADIPNDNTQNATQSVVYMNETMKHNGNDKTNNYSDVPTKSIKKTTDEKKHVKSKTQILEDTSKTINNFKNEIASSKNVLTTDMTFTKINSRSSKKNQETQVNAEKPDFAEEKFTNECEVALSCNYNNISSKIKKFSVNCIPQQIINTSQNEQFLEKNSEVTDKNPTVLLFSTKDSKTNQSTMISDHDKKICHAQKTKQNITSPGVTNHLFSRLQEDVNLEQSTTRQKTSKENNFQNLSQNTPKTKHNSMDFNNQKSVTVKEEVKKILEKSEAMKTDLKTISIKSSKKISSDDSSSSNFIFDKQSDGSAKSTSDIYQDEVLLGRIKCIKKKKVKNSKINGTKHFQKERSKSLSSMVQTTSDNSQESVNKLAILNQLTDLSESGDFEPDFAEYIQFFKRSQSHNFLNDCNFSFINHAKVNVEYPRGTNMNIPKHDNAFIQKIFTHLPSVSTILNNTLPVASKSALSKWKTKVMNEVGVTGFEKLREDRLHNDVQFHECIQRHLTGTPLEELFEFASPIVKKCLLSLKSVFPNLTLITLLEAHVVHAQLPYHGIVDCVALYDNNPVLIEWKQADSRMSLLRFTYDAPVQLAAYLGAFNHDKMYTFPVKTGLIIVAYTDGTPADTFPLSNDDCHRYWRVWLTRLASYLDLKRNY